MKRADRLTLLRERRRLKRALARADAHVGELEEFNAMLEERVRQLEGANSNLRGERASLQASLQSVTKRVEQLKVVPKAEADWERLREELRRAKADLAELEADRGRLLEVVARLQVDLATANETVAEQARRLNRVSAVPPTSADDLLELAEQLKQVAYDRMSGRAGLSSEGAD